MYIYIYRYGSMRHPVSMGTFIDNKLAICLMPRASNPSAWRISPWTMIGCCSPNDKCWCCPCCPSHSTLDGHLPSWFFMGFLNHTGGELCLRPRCKSLSLWNWCLRWIGSYAHTITGQLHVSTMLVTDELRHFQSDHRWSNPQQPSCGCQAFAHKGVRGFLEPPLQPLGVRLRSHGAMVHAVGPISQVA